MIITLKKDAPQAQVEKLIKNIEKQGLRTAFIAGTDYNVFGIIGDATILDERLIRANKYVYDVFRITPPYRKTSRFFHPQDTIVEVGDYKIGGKEKLVIIGGPCSVEEQASFLETAKAVKTAGAQMLRGGAYKPRTSPYAFQGMGAEGIHSLCAAKSQLNLPIVTELMSVANLQEFLDHQIDVIQVGARNMQNFELLKELGKIKTPILLKRGLAATIEEWLMSAEYILAGGNENVILCERGIRTFETYTRNTLDLSVIPIIKQRSHLPIIIDPSHATGDWKLVEAMSLAAIAAGADGLMIEVHHNPEQAWSDGAQSLRPAKFATLIQKSKEIAKVIGRDIY